MAHPALEWLAELSRRDPSRNAFGARHHNYRSTRVDLDTVRQFESELGIPLPPEYREFLLSVGSGAGPYYGILSPNEALAELRGYDYDEEKSASPSSAFPLAAEDLRGIELRIATGIEPAWVERDWPCDGCLPICEQGCTFHSMLALTGEFAGRVFDINHPTWGLCMWLPAKRPSGWQTAFPIPPRKLPDLTSPPTFEEWFYGWVEQALSDLSQPPD